MSTFDNLVKNMLGKKNTKTTASGITVPKSLREQVAEQTIIEKK